MAYVTAPAPPAGPRATRPICHAGVVQPRELVTITRTEGAAISATARQGLDAPIPACPGWTVASVVSHTALVYRRTTHVLHNHLVERPAGSDWYVDPPEGPALLDWFDDAHDEIVRSLEAADPDERVWTFHRPNHTASFWLRRLAHETTVHRVDVQGAHGPVDPVPGPVAIDGIDEALDVLIGPGLAGRYCGDDVTIHLHATDEAGEWLLSPGPEGVIVERRHAKGDAAVRGRASDLLLWLWGRGELGRLEVFGDRSALTSFRDLVAAAT